MADIKRSPEQATLYQTLKYAYLDIDELLQEGFDSNAEEQIANLATGQPCMRGIAETLTAIKNIISETEGE